MHEMLIPIEDNTTCVTCEHLDGCIRELYSLKHFIYLLCKLLDEASQQGAVLCDDQ